MFWPRIYPEYSEVSTTRVKVQMKSYCPCLLYGFENFSLNKSQIKYIECLQASNIKRMLGFPKRSHHSDLLRATGTYAVESLYKNNILSLWHRIFTQNTACRKINATLLSEYVTNGKLIPNTLLSRIVNLGMSPVKCIFQKQKINYDLDSSDGVVDSLKHLIRHENFIKPYSNQHVLAVLLTKAF